MPLRVTERTWDAQTDILVEILGQYNFQLEIHPAQDVKQYYFIPYTDKLNNLDLQPLEVVSGYRDPQLQVGENYSY